MKRKLFAGITSVSLPIFVQDTSSTTGGGLGSLTHATSGLVGEYRRQGQSSWTAITLVAGTLGTYTSGGWVADGSLTGAYEVGIPDAALASGARFVAIRFRGAANMLPVLIELELDAVNYQDGVRFGMSALPNVASGNAGAVITSGTGTAQLSVTSGSVTVGSNTDKTGYQVSAMSANVITATTIASAAITNSKFAAGAITNTVIEDDAISSAKISASAYSSIGAAVWAVLTSTLTTAGTIGKYLLDRIVGTLAAGTHNPQSGDSFARLGAPSGASVSADIAALATYVDTEVAAIKVATDRFLTMIVLDGAVYKYTPNALEDAPVGGGSGGSGDASQATLLEVKAKTDLIVQGKVTWSGTVDENGEIPVPIFIGDDYLETHGNAFSWDIPAIPGMTAATVTVKFGGTNALLGKSWLVTGTATDLGTGFWRLKCNMDRTVSGQLLPALYVWSVEVSNGSGTEITKVYSDRKVEVRSKPT